MFKSSIDLNDTYFYMSFGPILKTAKEYGLEYVIENDIYIHKLKKTIWKKVLLYDTGWGQPYGYEKLPQLSFDNLIQLILKSYNTNLKPFEEDCNKYGAVAVIMDRYVNELVDFLIQNINNDELFCNDFYKKNLKLFCFDSKKSHIGGSGSKSYEDILKKNIKWDLISSKIKQKVYI